jgi:O-antigen/teichoic acid export membrane protein
MSTGGDRSLNRSSFVWTFSAYGVVGLSGLALNWAIVEQFDVAALGRYNLFVAVVLVGGQLGSVSIHSSILYHAPEARTLGHSTGQVLSSGLLLTLATSTIATVVIAVAVEVIFGITENPAYHDGLRAVLPALLLYPINKALLSHLNGLRRFRAFSVAFAARFVLLAVFALIAGFHLKSEGLLPWTISATEVLILVVLLLRLRSELVPSGRRVTLEDRYRRHIRFGLRGFVGGLLLDLNTRVDVLLLGLLAGSRSVGVYSISSLFAESIFQLAMVARYSYDPVVTTLFVEGRFDELRETIHLAKRRVYLLMVAVIVLANLAYPIVVGMLFGKGLVRESWPVFALLCSGIAISAGYIPFTNLLQQVEAPGRQSLLLGLVGGTNVLLNLLLIPPFGIVGAALATAVAQASFVLYVRFLSRPLLGFSP